MYVDVTSIFQFKKKDNDLFDVLKWLVDNE